MGSDGAVITLHKVFLQFSNNFSVLPDQELEVVLAALTQFLGHSNSFIVGVAYNEVTSDRSSREVHVANELSRYKG